MNLPIYLEDPISYNDLEFVIRAYTDEVNFSYIIQVFFVDGRKANNLSYSVSYVNQQDLLASTGDNAVLLLMDHAKDDIKAGHYFR